MPEECCPSWPAVGVKGSLMRTNRVKHELRAGRVQIGTYIDTFSAPQLPPLLASAGFDYVTIDMEHSSFSIETVSELCTASLHAGIVPLVRPPGREPHLLTRPMDNGSMGIYMPHVDTADDAEAVVRAIKFPPVGKRGSHPANVNTDFRPIRADDYMPRSNEETLIVVQIECARAIKNIESILSVSGVDAATVGRGDLALDLGFAGQQTHPEVLSAVDIVIAACRRSGKIAGMKVPDVATASTWMEKGVLMLTYSSATSIMSSAAAGAVESVRARLDRARINR